LREEPSHDMEKTKIYKCPSMKLVGFS